MADIINEDLKELLIEGSYLMYEFKDVEVLAEDDNGIIKDSDNHTYKKLISPLFAKDIINSVDNQGLLEVMSAEIPYYFRESNLLNISPQSNLISISRDSGINDVPYPMQNEFWSVWFRDSQGFLQNSLLLEVYNKLRFPFINENQYLNASLFPELAKKVFTSESGENSLIEFKYTEEDNLADIEKGDRGCVDYLEDIIAQKLSSMYKILDYNPEQFVLLSDWGESLYKSGRIDEAEVDREKTIFKLQDLKHELVRRKYAGSATLYNLALSSIDRQGSFIGVIPAGRLNNVFTVFRDKRYLRIVNIPGILSKFANLEDNKPLKTFYEIPYAENENYIPVGTCEPLFYTSSSQSLQRYGVFKYNPENFYLEGALEVNLPNNDSPIDDIESYRNIFLRDNVNRLDWDSLTGIISSESINDFYPKLDEIYNGEFRTLDSDYVDTFGNTSPMRLDIITPFFSLASVVGNFLDISANKLLYHRNTIQENLGDNYDYMTYPIAGNNGVCLMDIPWMDYLNNSTSKKSRIQDQSFFGVQANTYANFTDPQLYDYTFFCLSYAGEDLTAVDLQPFKGGENPFKDFYSYKDYKEHYKDHEGWTEEPKYAYLWYFTIEANILEFPIMGINGRIIAKILLNIKESNYSDIINDKYAGNFEEFKKDFEDLEEFNFLTKGGNLGPLPFTYTNLVTYRLENAGDSSSETESIYNGLLNISLGLKTREDDEGNPELIYDNVYSELGYRTAFFTFSDDDLSVDSSIVFKSKEEFESPDVAYQGMNPLALNEYFTENPSEKTKLVYFGIERIEDFEYKKPIKIQDSVDPNKMIVIGYEDPIKVKGPTYYWSHPIRVVSLNRLDICRLQSKTLHPDWYKLCYHMNPYLNFVQDSASTLRHKKVIPSFETADLSQESIDALRGPSQFAGLSNLTRSRGYDFCCNDDGTLDAYDAEGAYEGKPYGMYLERLHPEIGSVSARNREYAKLYGDNRTDDVYNRITTRLYDGVYITNRSDIFYDDREIPCLRIERGTSDNPATIGYEEISLNQLLISPAKTSLCTDNTYDNWYWNVSSPGISFFINLRPIDIRLMGTAEIYQLESTTGELSEPIIKYDTIEIDSDEVIIQRLSNYDKGITNEFTPDSEFSLKLIHRRYENEEGKFVIESRYRYEYYLFGTNKNTFISVESDPIGEVLEDSINLYDTFGATSFWGIGEESATRDKIIYNNENVGLSERNVRIGVSAQCNETSLISDNHEDKRSWPVNEITISMAIDEKMYQKIYKIIKNPLNEGFLLGTDSTINSSNIAQIADAKDKTEWPEGLSELSFIDGQEFDYSEDVFFAHSGENFLPGIPMKKYMFKGENKSLKYIEVASEYNEVEKSQKKIFLGNIYDIRLYNTGFTSDILALYNQGIMRELYSYAPSTYKLAYNIYRDYGIFKPIKGIPITAGRIADIGTIRLFDRSVWDSVLVDMYPISTDEMASSSPQFDPSFRDPLSDRDVWDEEGNLIAIEQDLVEDSEVSNNMSTTNNVSNDYLAITYRGRTIKIDGHHDLVSVINTSIYPVQYKNHLFASDVELKAVTVEGGMRLSSSNEGGIPNIIEIPARQVGETLKYNARMSLNFNVEPSSDLSIYFSRGTNIGLKWHDALDCSVVERVDESVAGTTANHILIPLTIPKQDSVPDSSRGTLDRFLIKNFQLNGNLLTFLRASNYYKEVRIPIASLPNMGSTPYFVYKWDAIRTLREGSYYFTVKYPIQIIPFMDEDFNAKSETNFPMLYLASRFKVEVKGNPIPYDASKFELKGIPAEYTKANIQSTIASGNSIYNPSDNRTFPHREMNIDFYVMDGCDAQGTENINYAVGSMDAEGNEAYAFRWKKIASNYSSEICDEYCERISEPILLYKKDEDGEYVLDENNNLIPIYNAEDGGTTENIDEALKDADGNPIQAYETDEFGNIQYSQGSYTPRPIILLDEERLNSGISMSEEIPMFIVKNIQSPFFIAKFNRATDSYDHTSADDDTISPINILPLYNDKNLDLEKDGMSITSEADLDNITLVAGKTYYLVFDYEAKVSEVSFIDEVFSDGPVLNEEGLLERGSGNYYELINGQNVYRSYVITDSSSEKKHYSRMVSLLNTNGLDTDYMYDKAAQWSGIQTNPITARTSGFMTASAEEIEQGIADHGWVPVNTSIDSDVNTFGNPYSRASTRNYLISVYPAYRGALENLCYFPYVISDEIEEDGTSSRIYPAKYMTELDVIIKSNNAYTRSTINFDENKILKQIFDSGRTVIKSSIASLIGSQSPSSGFFDYLSLIRPNIHYEATTEETIPLYTSIVNARDYYFYGYDSSDRTLPSRNNNIKITRSGVYSNNLLRSKDFDNSNYWWLNYAGSYVSDESWDDGVGKDVYRFIYDEPIIMRYNPKSSEVIETQYEVALNISVRTPSIIDVIKGNNSNVKVYAQFLLNDVEVGDRVELTDINISQNKGDVMPMSILPDENNVWYTFSKELENKVKADSVEFQIEVTGPTDEINVFVTKPVIRSFSSVTEILGMYDAIHNRSNASSKLQLVGHKVVMFVDKETGEPIPVQFRNTKGTYANSSTSLSTGNYAQTNSDRVSMFFSNYNLGPVTPDNVKLYKLIRPWERRIYYWYKKEENKEVASRNDQESYVYNKVTFRKPRKFTDSLGVTSEQIEKVDLTRDDIFSCPSNDNLYGIVYDQNRNGLVINGILLKTDEENRLKVFNTNLKIYTSDPLEFLDERFSLLSNCFNPTAYLNNEESPVAVTNIQLLSPDDGNDPREIIYEFEYLPIIYDESRQHISFNILLHKSNCIG